MACAHCGQPLRDDNCPDECSCQPVRVPVARADRLVPVLFTRAVLEQMDGTQPVTLMAYQDRDGWLILTKAHACVPSCSCDPGSLAAAHERTCPISMVG